MRNIINQQEHNSAKDTSLCCQRTTDTSADNTEGTPEERIADTCKRSHKSRLYRIYGFRIALFSHFLCLFQLLLHSNGYAGNEGNNSRSRIKNHQMTF